MNEIYTSIHDYLYTLIGFFFGLLVGHFLGWVKRGKCDRLNNGKDKEKQE